MEEYAVPKKMKKVGDLFEKYRKLIKPPQASVEKVCVAVIAEVFKYPISIDQMTYVVSTRTLSVRIPSLLKSELKFHYSEILKILEERLGKDTTPKIIR